MGNKTSKLSPEVINELLETTEFEEDEIKHWYKDFLKDFPEGHLSLDQFKDIYIQHFPNGDATRFAEHVFRTFDQDNSHTLDFREFMCALSITAKGGPKEKLQWAFQMYDIDENGYITKDECTEIVKAIYRMQGGGLSKHDLLMTPQQRVDHLFEIVDVNKDGRVSMEEFVEGAYKDPTIMRGLSQDDSQDPSTIDEDQV